MFYEKHCAGTKMSAEGSAYHHTGTARIGLHAQDGVDGGVIDQTMKVFGTTNLRVADASASPKMPTANGGGPAMMFGGAAGIFAVRAHRAAVAATRVCKDDPHGTVAANGYTCAEVLYVYADDCGAASAVPGATVADLCPLTCKSHQKSPCYESGGHE